MLRGHGAAAVAIGAFRSRENALGKTRSTREHFANAGDFDNVYANGNDHGNYQTKRRRFLLART